MRLRIRCSWPCLVWAAAFLGACSTPAPPPTDPAGALQSLQSRRLDDTRLRQFIESVRPGADDSWDLDRLCLAALYFHPDIPLARSGLDLAAAEAQTASSHPLPGFMATLGRGAGGALAASPWIAGAAIDVLVQSPDRRKARLAAADAGVIAARAALDQTAWQVRARVAAALLGLWSSAQRGRIGQEQLALQEERLAFVQRRLAAGESSREELRREQEQLAQLRLTLVQTEADRARAHVDLAEAIGVPEIALGPAEAATSVFARPPELSAQVTSPEVRAQALQTRADLRGARARLDAAQAQLQEQAARRWPDLHLGPGYLFDQGSNKYELTLGLDWPTAAEGLLAEAIARRNQAAQRLIAAQAGLLAQLERSAAAWRSAERERGAADTLRERTQQAEAAAQARFAAGALDHVALLAVRIDALAAANAQLLAHEHAWTAALACEDAAQQVLAHEAKDLPPLDRAPEPAEKGTL